MRRVIVLALALVLMGTLVPAAYAQAPPAPSFGITGFLDTITSASKNLRDNNFTRTGDSEWYARNRGRFDITGRVGTAIVVWGIELDLAWGQVSGTDNVNDTSGTAGGLQRAGSLGAFDLNTDVRGIVETKWLYTEFDMPGLSKIAPTRMRLGAQPFQTQYKLGTLANGDFSGVNVVSQWSPNVRSHITFAQIEEELHGPSTSGSGITTFNRGNDLALILSVEVTPIKGLDVRPIYALAYIEGVTNGATRVTVGGIPTAGGTPTFANRPVGGLAAAGPGLTGSTPASGLVETRHTIGVDTRFRKGPFSLEPTIFYQFGDRDTDNPFSGGSAGTVREAEISAWLFDVKSGFRVGPLLLEARYLYTSGNRPMDQLSHDVNYYQPISTDTGYGADGWGNIFALGIDYFNGALRTLGTGVGWDRYGRQMFGLKATYSVTPALDLYASVMPNWTARSVDTDGIFTAGAVNCTTNSGGAGSGCRGDESYLGTEVNAGVTWRFAPGITLDLVGAYLFAGSALDTTFIQNGVATKQDAKDIYTGAARLRVSF